MNTHACLPLLVVLGLMLALSTPSVASRDHLVGEWEADLQATGHIPSQRKLERMNEQQRKAFEGSSMKVTFSADGSLALNGNMMGMSARFAGKWSVTSTEGDIMAIQAVGTMNGRDTTTQMTARVVDDRLTLKTETGTFFMKRPGAAPVPYVPDRKEQPVQGSVRGQAFAYKSAMLVKKSTTNFAATPPAAGASQEEMKRWMEANKIDQFEVLLTPSPVEGCFNRHDHDTVELKFDFIDPGELSNTIAFPGGMTSGGNIRAEIITNENGKIRGYLSAHQEAKGGSSPGLELEGFFELNATPCP